MKSEAEEQNLNAEEAQAQGVEASEEQATYQLMRCAFKSLEEALAASEATGCRTERILF